ncbi:MAG: hypothetical protein V7711_18750 [Pseudomonadales bacterium]
MVLNKDNQNEWVTLEHGEEKRYYKEPDTSFWQRFSAGFTKLFVPESQL